MTEVMTEAMGETPPAEPAARGRLAVLLGRLGEPGPALTGRGSFLWSLAVAAYLIGGWWLVQFGWRGWLAASPALGFYVIQPILWTGLAVLAFAGWRRLDERPPFSRMLTAIALLLGTFHVALYVFAGLAAGFGDSFVAGRLVNYPRNLMYLATGLVGLEVARAFILTVWRQRSERWALVATTALLALALTPYGQLQALTSSDTLVATLGGFLIPTLVLSILATWLADHGGPGPAVAYRGALLAFEWFSQVQPDLEWPIVFAIGTAGPILAARLIRSIYLSTPEGAARWVDHHDEEVTQRHPTAGSMAAMAILIVIFGFAAGLGFRPGVVSGISMEPTIGRGDLVIVLQHVDPQTLTVGDIVKFADPNGRTIIHRIIAIDESEHGLVFTTQGDNNQRPDPQFDASNLRGKVVSSLPAVGWPAIWIRGD